MKGSSDRFLSILLDGHDLTGEGSWLADLKKAATAGPELDSNQGSFLGRRERPLDFDRVAELKDHNVHHSAALEAKVRAAVGLGHRQQRIHDELDPLCVVSWQDTLDAAISDYCEFGNGFIEVVRDEGGAIASLYHIPACDIWVFVEDNDNVFHYELSDRGGHKPTLTSLTGLRFARFGERDDFIRRHKVTGERRKRVSEVIHFAMNRGRRSRHYGYPDWVAATPAMELDHCVTQYAFDLFINGGIPEGIFSVTGQRLAPDDWQAIKDEFRKHQGIGNRRKLMLLNIAGTELKVQLDKLTLDGQTTGDNQALVDDQALKIVSAHRVPPLLCGIQIPGKLGAANEMSNSIMAFQTLVISHVQKAISTVLATTLGDAALGVEGLSEDDFRGVGTGDPEPDPTKPPNMTTGMPALRPKDHKGNGFHTIVDEIDLGTMDTVSRMRTSVPEANARGRDLSAGTATRGKDIAEGQGKNRSAARRKA